jgi:hypothetical protein
VTVWAVEPPIIVDCERIVHGFLAQPVNAATSLAFVVAGALVAWRRPDRRFFGLLVALVGVGSFLFHGPMPYQAEWLHDVTIGWVLAAVALDRARHWMWTAIPALALVFALVPAAADPIMVVIAAGLVISEGTRGFRLRNPVGPLSLAVLAVGAGVGTMSRTGWPWCDPDSLIQGHAVWHLLAASALFIWGVFTRPGIDTSVDSRE